MTSDVGHSLKIEIFRDIYQYSLKKQVKRMDKWSEALGCFMKELLRRREFLQLQEFELSLYNSVVALSMAAEVVSTLRDNSNVQLTMLEWEFVYFQSMQAYQDAKVVLADRNGLGCELFKLAGQLSGMLDLFPITVLEYSRGTLKEYDRTMSPIGQCCIWQIWLQQ